MTNLNRFFKQHVLITGAARGIGFEIACQFAKEGAVVSIIDIQDFEIVNKAATAITKLTGAIVYAYKADITERQEIANIILQIEEKQPIDILINNAGIAYETPFLKIDIEEWKRVIDVNLTGFFNVSQLVCRHMAQRKKGVVVNMSSKNGLDGEFGYAHYNASKAGIIMLTKTMALELAHLNIRVNAVCPGYIQTPLSASIDSPEFTQDFVDKYIPLNRPGTVSEIAPLFLFLASPESSFITGQVFIADGGQLAGQKPSKQLLTTI